jgi:acyl transferase domain-containing protein/NAD(P)-dependent dehydrogenase (short-subunit alcohol dehydrogenase family)/acyl carrier protein/SAM-dependent methyltransferase
MVAAVELAPGGTLSPALPLPTKDNYRRLRVTGAGVECLTLHPCVLPPTVALAVPADAVAIITGGGGVIGRRCAEQLAAQGWRRIALLGRSQDAATTATSSSHGSEWRGFACDVSDGDVLATVLAEIREWGPIGAIVHGAGVLADGMRATQPWSIARSVLAPKLLGGLHLDTLTAGDPLQVFVAHASVVGIIGNAAQTAYGAANGALEGLVAARIARGAEGRSGALAWGLWRDGGMGDAAIATSFEQAGLPPLTAEDAAPVLAAALSGAIEGSMLVLGGAMDLPAAVNDVDAMAATYLSDSNHVGAAATRRVLAEAFVRDRISALTGESAERLDPHDTLFDLGLDSLDLQSLTTELSRHFTNLSPTVLFRYSSIAALADYLATQSATDAAPPVIAALGVAAAGTPFSAAVVPTQASRAEADVADSARDQPVAIIGMSGRFPMAPDLWAFWDNLLQGRDCIRPVPAERWQRALGRRPDGAAKRPRWGGFLDNVDHFDPLFFNLSVREAERMDPQQRLVLENAWHTLEHAGYSARERHAGRAVGVFVGTMWNEYSLYAAEQGYLAGAYGGPGALGWQISNRVSYHFDFTGPSLTIDTACSSSLTAIHLACQALRAGDCEMALAGGVNLSLHPAKYDYLQEGRFLSSDGRCRSFGAGGDGYVPGEGVASVLLKPLARALADGDRIYGVVLSSAVNHGGRAAGFTAPNPAAQQALAEQALQRAGVTPQEISYVECHGTGTALGDPIEIAALEAAYAGRTATLPIGSVKSAIGHLEAAAGVAGLIKILLSMEYQRLPPNLHVDPANPAIDFANSPFRVLNQAKDWRPDGAPRIAGLSSFGAGGSNAHALIAGPEFAAALPGVSTGAATITVSARTLGSLASLCLRLAERVGPLRDPALGLSDVAATLARRPVCAFAVQLHGATLDELAERLRRAADELAGGADLAVPLPPRISGGRQCSLPGTPFDGAAYWLPQVTKGAVLIPPHGSQLPVLACERIDPQHWRFRLHLDASRPWLRDHEIGGSPVLSAALGLELLRQAASATGALGERFELHGLAWLRAIVGDSDLVIDAYSHASDRLTLTITDDRGVAVRGAAVNVLATAAADFAIAGGEPLDSESLYERLAMAGMRYAGAYRSLRTLTVSRDGVSARVEEGRGADWLPGRVLSPVLVDGALQAVLGWLGTVHQVAAAVPVAIERVEWQRPLPAAVDVVASIRAGPGKGLWQADLSLRDDAGNACVTLGGVLLQALDPHRLTSPEPIPAATTQVTPTAVAFARLEWRDVAGIAASAPRTVAVTGLAGAPTSAILAAWRGTEAHSWDGQQATAAEAAVIVLGGSRREGWQLELAAVLQRLVLSRRPIRVLILAQDQAPQTGAIGGLLRSLRHEHPGLDGRLLMVSGDPAALADAAVGELALGRPHDPELRLVDGHRQCRAERPLRSIAAPAVADLRGVWLITGGLGGLGLQLARRLIDRGATGIALVGRRALSPDPAQTIALAALAATGIPITALAADVTDSDSLRVAVQAAVARLGPLTGVVHAAGMTRDGMLHGKDLSGMSAVLAPKLHGAQALDRATADQPLDYFVLFSSISGVRGNFGQTDYGYANRFLDLFAEAREQRCAAGERSGRSIAIDWPLWEQGGMQVDARTQEWLRENLHTDTLTPTQGLDAFEHVLAMDEPQVLVTVPVHTRAIEGRPVPGAPATIELRPRLQAHLLAVLAATTKIAVERLDGRRPVDDYGVDSVLGMEMVQALELDFGSLPRILFYEHPSLDAVADYLLAQRSEAVHAWAGDTPSRAAVRAGTVAHAFRAVVSAGEDHDRADVVFPDAPIAVIGLAGRYPDAPDLDTFWHNLRAGHDAIRAVPESRWAAARQAGTDQGHGLSGGFLDDVDAFDPLLFGISPRDARLMDPQARLFLEQALAALEDGGHAGCVEGRAIGVFVAAMWGQYELLGAGVSAGPVPNSSFAEIANRVSYAFGLTGPSLSVDSMCSGSLTALHLACDSLRRGECEMALAGGVNLSLRPEKYRQLIEGGYLSADGRCRSFGEGGDGYVPGEGVGVALLKPLHRAVADGDAIWGVITASAINHGGRAKGYTVPSPAAQASVVRAALERARLAPGDIEYIEAHGTGTALGDPIELAGLAAAFDVEPASTSRWRLGSVKSQIGHCEAAAGIAGMTKVLLQLRAGELAPSLHAQAPNSAIDWDAKPFDLVTAVQPWPAGGIAGKPRRAVVSAFGAGGSNAHLVIEEAPAIRATGVPGAGPVVVPVSARTSASLHATVAALAQALDQATAVAGPALARQALAEALAMPADELLDDDHLNDLGLDAVALDRLIARCTQGTDNTVRRDLLVGARTVGDLLGRLSNAVQSPGPDSALVDIGFTLAVGRLAQPERLCIVVDSVDSLRQGLKAFVDGGPLPSWLLTARAGTGAVAVKATDDATAALAAGDPLALATAWVGGAAVDWSAWFGRRRRVRLPGIALERKSYWYVPEEDAAAKAMVGADAEWIPKSEFATSTAAVSLARTIAAESIVRGEALATAQWLERAARYAGDAVTWSLQPDGIAVITMNAAARRNMFDDALTLGLIRAFDAVSGSGEAKVVVLAGTADVFSMGGTPEMLQAIANGEANFTDVPFFYRGLLECPVPVITAMAGHAYGGGLLFGLYGDIPILARESLYSAVFADHGFSPGMGATLILPERLGHGLAAEMMYTARAVTGAELRDRGVNVRVCPRNEVLGQALELARSLAAKPRRTLLAMKQSLARRLREQLPAAISEERAMHSETFNNDEVRATLARRFAPAPGRDEIPAVQSRAAVGPGITLTEEGIASSVDAARSPAAALVVSATQGLVHLRPSGSHASRASAPMDGGQDVLELVRAAVARILMMSPAEVADDRAFLDQGLDSIGSAELARSLSAQFGQRIDTTALYDHGSPAALAAFLEASQGASAVPLARPTRLRPVGPSRPSPAAGNPPVAEATSTPAIDPVPAHVPATAPVASSGVALIRDGAAPLSARLQQLEQDDLAADPGLTDQRLDSIGAVAAPSHIAANATALGADTGPLSIPQPEDAIAVIGMACRYPGANNAGRFWRNQLEGMDFVGEIPAARWDGAALHDPDSDAPGRSVSRWGGFLDNVSGFDADFFRISPMQAEIMDPQQRIALEQCWRALEDAGMAPDRLAGVKCGVYMAAAGGDYEDLLAGAQLDLTAEAFTGLAPSILAARIAYHLDLTGPAMSIDTACSSSLVAVHQARQALLAGDCDLALAGGIMVMTTPKLMVKSSKAGMLSPTGRCRPFSDKADGIALAEGVGVVVLKQLEAAMRDGDPILAVLRASGVNQDGRTNGITSPSARSQAALMREVYARAHIEPASIGFVETHGTGTALGDPIEFKALCEAYAGAPVNGCVLGSAKASIGHATMAAGIAGLITAVQAVRSGEAPALGHFDRANPLLDLAGSPFRIPGTRTRWGGAAIRRAAVSSFGFSGTNAHVVVEQHLSASDSRPSPSIKPLPFLLSAHTPEALLAVRTELADWLRGDGLGHSLADIALTLSSGRAALSVRWAVAAPSREALLRALDAEADATSDDGEWSELCALWRSGAGSAAAAALDALGGRRIQLPGYPFQHRRFWIDTPSVGTSPPLGLLLPARGTGRVILGAGDALLQEHRAGASGNAEPLLAGAAYLAIALAAIRDAAGSAGPITLSGVQWLTPLQPATAAAEVFLRLSTEADAAAGAFEVVSGAGAAEDLHASGRYIRAPASAPSPHDLATLQQRCRRAVAATALRASFAAKGLQLSGRFAQLEELHCNDSEVLGRLQPLAGMPYGDPDPGLIDSALQCVALLIDPTLADNTLYLPVALAQFRLHAPLATARYSWVSDRGGDPSRKERCFDVEILDAGGQVLAECRGFTLRQVTRRNTAAVQLLTPRWREFPSPPAGSDDDQAMRIEAGTVPPESARPLLWVWPGGSATDLFGNSLGLIRAVAALGRRRRRLTIAVNSEMAARALTGFALSLGLEEPRVQLRVVWLDAVADNDPRLLALATSAPAPVLSRVTATAVTHLDYVPYEQPPLGPRQLDGLWLISGGLGKLGLRVGAHLARRGARVALLARAQPSPQALMAMQAIATHGHAPLLRVLDLADADALALAVEELVAEAGPVQGVVHAAGLLRDGLLGSKNDEDWRAVLSAKIDVAQQLADALAAQPLQAFVCFTSIAALKGQPGQTDYAFANGWLDGLASYSGVPWRAIAWPWWRDGGMPLSDAEIERARTELGIVPLETAAGLASFDAVLDAGLAHCLVVPGDAQRLLGPLAPPSEVSPPARQAAPSARGDRVGLVASELTGLVVELLKVDRAQVAAHRPFADYGFESITLTRFATRINRNLGLNLSPSVFFEAACIGELAELIVARHGADLPLPISDAPAPAADGGGPTTAVGVAHPSRVTRRPAASNIAEPIAVIGMDGRFPGGGDLECFWEHLAARRDLISEIPPERWDWREVERTRAPGQNAASRWGGFLDEVARFDAGFFGISPREAELMDPQQRLFLETSWRAIEDAGLRPGSLAGSDTGVFVGVATSDYMDLMSRNGAVFEGHAATGMSHGMLPNRVSFLLDLHGPSEPVDTSCSSSLVAVARAVEAIRRGDCALAIAGGVNQLLSPTLYLAFGQAGMLSPRGRCRSFDAAADGYVRGEGVGAIVLKPLSRALADGDPVHGVIRGIGVAHGGRAHSLTAPNARAQGKLIADVLARAGVEPASVEYIETHGTGTPLGDPIEIAGLVQAFATTSEDRTGPCALGAVKGNIGHLEAAAGIAGMIKVLLAMRHRALPGNVHFKHLNPHIRLEGTPFEVSADTRPWPAHVDADGAVMPRRAGLSSFGFGGVNVHAVLEEPPAALLIEPDDAGPQLVVLSARSDSALRAQADRLAEHLARAPALSLAQVAYTLQRGREAQPHRLALIADSLAEARASLDAHDWRGAVVDTDAATDAPAPLSLPIKSDRTALGSVASAWLAGADVDWTALHGGPRRRVSLPGTVFEGRRHWAVDARPVTGAAAAAHAHDVSPGTSHTDMSPGPGELLEDCLFAPAWVTLPEPRGARLRGPARVLRLSGNSDLIPLLQRGHDGTLELIDEASPATGFTGTLYVLDTDSAPQERSMDAQRAGEISLLRLFAMLANLPPDDVLDLVLITRGATDAAGRPPTRPSASAAIAMILSCAAERPHWRVRALDLAGAIDETAFDDAVDRTGPVLRALVGTQVVHRVLQPVRVTDPVPLRQHGVWVLLGGGGGIAGALAVQLAHRTGARIALVGRRPQDAAIARRLAAIATAGGEALYLSADAAEPGALREALQEVTSRWGPPDVVVTATMVLRDRALTSMDTDDFLAAYRAKTRPAVALEAVLAQLGSPTTVLHMSSVQSFLGNPGQANYAAGCGFLDAWAAAADGAVKVINWGFWGNVGAVANANQRAAMAARGVDSIEAPEGLAALAALLHGARRQLVMAKGRPEALARLGVASADADRASSLDALDALEAAVPAAVAQALARALPARAPRPQWTDLPAWRSALPSLPSEPQLAALLDLAGRATSNEPPALDDLARRHPTIAAHVALLRAAMEGLPGVLRGDFDGAGVLLPNGSPALVEAIYANNPFADAANAKVAELCADRSRAGATRFLEVGAGTGGTSAAVLAALPPSVDEYCYTDVSRAFTQYGWRRFRAVHPFARFELLDIERDLLAQGFSVASFDVVIAANVLHATVDAAATLRRLGALLRPGGTLVINELTRRFDFNTATFGLLPGWWRSADNRRMTHGPLLDVDGWQAALAAAGFGRADVWNGGHGLSVLTASAAPALATAGPAPPVLMQIFSELLRMPVADINPRASFSELGVDSILAGELAGRLASALGVTLKATELYNHPSPAKLQAHLDTLVRAPATLTKLDDRRVPTSSPPPADADPLLTLLKQLERGEISVDAAGALLDRDDG